MICQRCGQCCLQLDISVINPRSILLDGNIDPEGPEPMVHKPAGESCPHLFFDEKQATCIIHHLPCYQGTPCQQFEQIGPEDAVCMLNVYYNPVKPSKP